MRHAFGLALLVGALAAGPASAACFADYKARSGAAGELRLHYGTARIAGACDAAAAEAELTPRLAAEGWTLLTVVSVFDEGGLAEREESAGDFHLRY